ncbi:MAG: hypothetical protein U0Q22_07110 [Acidimicrobiales bacterium]
MFRGYGGARAVVATLVVLAGVPSLVGSASAQDGTEPTGFVPGEATAQASTVVLGLSPGGGKPIDVSLGVSKARFQNRTATSEGAALNLGLLEIFLGPSSQCGDRPPIIPKEQLPPVSSNDSRRNQPMTTPLEVRSPGDANGPGGVLGTQIANAQGTPQQSTAQTTTVPQDFGLVALDGGHTEVSTRLSGGVREAIAVTTGTQLRILGGLVTINSPRWEAIARSGAVDTAEGHFTFASASIFGFDRPAAQFASDFGDVASGIGNLLSGLGVHLDYPKVVVDSGTVRVTPLVLGLANPPIGLDVIHPLLTALAPLKEQNARDMIAADCNNAAVLQIVDLVLGVLSGTGAVNLGIGGVSAFTAATEFPEPAPLDLGIVDAPAAPPVVLGQELTAPPVTTPLKLSSPVVPSVDLGSGLADLPATPIELPQTVAAAPPVTSAVAEPSFALPSATLVSRRYEPGSTGGAAALVGLAGVLGLIALAAGDRMVMRRTKKEIPD